ncbi:MAG TPA: inositol monophosphatase family protein [Polyangiaceae bacterium]|nr:inositol monophosphatase family protein [Polyangiaceae bacterium]
MAALDEKTLRDVLDFAVDSAQLAGAFTLGYFNASPPVELKADRTPVTAADRGAEERLRQRIESAFPTHGIVGEELGVKEGSEPARWILDPIDGTFSFICGVPLYAVLIGFEWEGEAVAGVIHLPALGDTIYAARGLGCRWNGRLARVSGVRELSEARLVFASSKAAESYGKGPEFARLLAAAGNDRGFCDAYGYALVATGRAEIAIDPRMALWDTAALFPVITEAGGTLTDWKGNATHTAPEAVATNGHLFSSVMGALRG